jgi:hypothetical protein
MRLIGFFMLKMGFILRGPFLISNFRFQIPRIPNSNGLKFEIWNLESLKFGILGMWNLESLESLESEI